MVRISNVELPVNKNVYIALSRIYGINKKFKKNSQSRRILEKLNINPLLKVKDLNYEQINLITLAVLQLKTESKLKQEIEQNIGREKTIRSRKGILHSGSKKVRGQRTHSNNRTRPNGIKSITVKALAVAGKKVPKRQG